MASCYRVLKALCIILNLVMYTLLLVMNYASNNKSGILFGNKSLAQMARKYYTEFNPAPWAFEIWKLVNAWTSLWILYSLTHIRRNVPDVLTPLFFVCFTMASVFNMAWTQFTSWDIINPATGFVFAILIFLYATLFCSYSGLYKQRYTCQLSRLRRESHACGLKTSISRPLTPADQFLTPDWKMWVVVVLLDTISKNMLTQTHETNENHV